MKLPKLLLPTFTGSYTDWMSFFHLFKASVDSSSHLSHSEKLNYLKACVKGEAARLFSSISITDANYNIALTLLKDRYENKRSIIQAHLQAIWSQPVLKNESALGLRILLELTNEHLRALVELGQPLEHWNAILVFVLTDKMDPESRKQWQLDNSGTDVLSWELLSKFLDTRTCALESGGTKVTPQSSVTSPCNQGNPTLAKRVQNYAVQGSSCESCQEDHRLYACSQFKGMCLADRHKFVKDKKLCFNCFQSGYSSNACPSKFICRECKMKHHTLLHRPQKQLPDQGNSTKTYSSMNSTSNKMESTKQFTTGHFSAENEINTVLLSTSPVTIRNSLGDAIKLRALLDSGSQASLVTEDVAKALMLPTQRSQINISTMGSFHFQKTRGLSPVKLNDTLEINLHLITKISNTIPDKEIDVSTMRHVNNLNLADPTFNVPNKVDLLLGADVIEDILLDNKIKDNGLCIRDSVFGWVVSGPVYSSVTTLCPT